MFDFPTFLTFYAAVLVIPPALGPDMLLIIGRGIDQGRRVALLHERPAEPQPEVLSAVALGSDFTWLTGRRKRVDCSKGRSSALTPFRRRSIKTVVRSKLSSRSGP